MTQLPESVEDLLLQIAAAGEGLQRADQGFMCYWGNVSDAQLEFRAASVVVRAAASDVKSLNKVGAIELSGFNTQGFCRGMITHAGSDLARALLQERQQPLASLPRQVEEYVDDEHFKREHTAAFAKWAQARALLSSPTTEENWTAIGHHCREAMQNFADDLVRAEGVTGYDADIAKTANRIKALVDKYVEHLGDTRRGLLSALLTYWRRASELVQRQEHGNAVEQGLAQDDAERVVFYTAMVMCEVEKAVRQAANAAVSAPPN